MNEENQEKVQEKKEITDKTSTKKEGEKYTGAILASLFSGVIIGFITGILFAPKKGKEIRKEIKDKSKELIDKSKKTVTETVDKTKKFTEKSKGKFEKVKDIIIPKKEVKDK